MPGDRLTQYTIEQHEAFVATLDIPIPFYIINDVFRASDFYSKIGTWGLDRHTNWLAKKTASGRTVKPVLKQSERTYIAGSGISGCDQFDRGYNHGIGAGVNRDDGRDLGGFVVDDDNVEYDLSLQPDADTEEDEAEDYSDTEEDEEEEWDEDYSETEESDDEVEEEADETSKEKEPDVEVSKEPAPVPASYWDSVPNDYSDDDVVSTEAYWAEMRSEWQSRRLQSRYELDSLAESLTEWERKMDERDEERRRRREERLAEERPTSRGKC